MIRLDLNGLWDFVIDLDPRYHRDPVYARPGFDRSKWHKAPVPGVWNYYAEKLDIYEGVGWFVREFSVEPLPPGAAARLRFGGVNYKCRVFLNGQHVGGHEGGYTEFTIDVSKVLAEGLNTLAVEVDNRETSTRLPPCLGYFNYGGIHRDVSLEIHPSAWLEELFIGAAKGELRVRGLVQRSREGLALRVRCNGVETRESVGDQFDVQFAADDVVPWSPDQPVLYPVTVELMEGEHVLHECAYRVGFRTIEMADGQILLNGRPIFLKGICYVYDSPVYGLTLKREQYLEDLRLLREMGVNTIRSHFPFTRAFYEACDEAGLMVWIEPPVYCIHPETDATGTVFSDPDFAALAEGMVGEMIVHARNHPSVVIYSVGNECNVENPEAEPFFRRLCQTVRSLDTTRLLSYASLYCIVGPLAEMVDILGINEYWGWYEQDIYSRKSAPAAIDLKMLDEKLDELKRKHAKPMLLTEFGADSRPGYFSASRDFWSEDYHADLIKETFAVLQRHREICGAFPFCFSDYRDPSKHVTGEWDGMNYKGVVSYRRRPKKAFDVLKYIYRKMS
ncbi:MAG: hypothetical protein GXY33_01520 [Phycisphaerae bacterium]|nr:hypothetical protein [Phycisphaerae bacterium]